MGFDIAGLGSVFDFGSKIIDKIFPDKTEAEKAKFEMYKLEKAGELQEIQNQFQLMTEQIKVNAIEAAHPSIFVSGWRPFVGWVCGGALFYNYIGMPMIVWTTSCFYPTAPLMPVLNTGELMTILAGMLGLGVLRTVEKSQKTDSK